MIVRRLAARRLVKSGSTEEEPRRKRAARFLLAILVAGLVSGVAAWLDIPPFGNVQALVRNSFAGSARQLPAQILFPAVQPTHKTVDVYDPPPAPRTQPTQPTQPTANPSSHPTPRPTPSRPPDD